MARTSDRTSDAVEILHRRFVEGKPEVEALVEEERLNASVAQQIYDLRMAAGLTQQQLAELVGTTTSVICRLEDADYQGHSLTMLRRLAEALSSRTEVHFIPKESARGTQGKVEGKRRPSRGKSETAASRPRSRTR